MVHHGDTEITEEMVEPQVNADERDERRMKSKFIALT
jgi:hypothetical protein